MWTCTSHGPYGSRFLTIIPLSLPYVPFILSLAYTFYLLLLPFILFLLSTPACHVGGSLRPSVSISSSLSLSLFFTNCEILFLETLQTHRTYKWPLRCLFLSIFLPDELFCCYYNFNKPFSSALITYYIFIRKKQDVHLGSHLCIIALTNYTVWKEWWWERAAVRENIPNATDDASLSLFRHIDQKSLSASVWLSSFHTHAFIAHH